MSEVGLANLVTVAEAIAAIDGAPVSPRTESIPLADADGRVSAVDVAADRDDPPFEKSLMDGYAVRAADTHAGGPLHCVGEIAAGRTHAAPLTAGRCVAIMTGAPLPPGADAVLPVENVTVDGDAVRPAGPVAAGHAVAARASNASAGEVVLPAGTRLGPAQLAVCAQVGAATVDVFVRPHVNIITTGDEIIPYDRAPAGSQIRGSNALLLAALLRRYGCDVYEPWHLPDDPDHLLADLILPGFDVTIVTGGMSMGKYDYTPRVLADLRYELAVTKLKIKPGKPFVFARGGAGAPFVFGLPGNPVSAFVCTVRLVSRLLLRMGGTSPEPPWVTAKLADDLPANGPREFYQPAVVENGVARVLAWRGSADLVTLARADALLVRMAHEARLPAGEAVSLLRLP